MVQQIEMDGIVLEIVRKRVRYLRLTVYPPVGAVRISAPLRMSARAIRLFATSRLEWIRRERQRLLALKPHAADTFLDGESHYVWGRPRLLEVIERHAEPAVELEEGTLRLQVRPGSSADTRGELMTNWHRALVGAAVPALIARWEPILRVTVARVSVRPMRTMWGSCTTTSRHIRLSTELARKPPDCLEYVVVHEMVHLLEPSHNRRFAALMDRFMPEWRSHRAELNRTLDAGALP